MLLSPPGGTKLGLSWTDEELPASTGHRVAAIQGTTVAKFPKIGMPKKKKTTKEKAAETIKM